MAKLLYTMGEVAERLGESTSAVRYWSNYFEKFIKPARNAKGNRLKFPLTPKMSLIVVSSPVSLMWSA